MRTIEWIARNKDKTDNKTRRFNSVFSDGAGTTYSYGWHYPLLFKLGGEWFVNTRGYSVTTAKHINWAIQAVDYRYHPIRVPSHYDGHVNPSEAERWLEDQATELILAMVSKKRKNTQVYSNLTRELADVKSSLKTVKGVISNG